jgi:hypothetical protein
MNAEDDRGLPAQRMTEYLAEQPDPPQSGPPAPSPIGFIPAAKANSQFRDYPARGSFGCVAGGLLAGDVVRHAFE